MPKLYPITLNLKDKNVVVIGAGHIALRKVKGLIDTGACITVIAPMMLPEFSELSDIQLIQRDYMSGDIKGAHLIYVATNNSKLNHEIACHAEDWQWVNDVSDARYSSFYTPAVIREEGAIFAISTENHEPRRSKQIKEDLQKVIKELM